ncbi:MAG: Na+-dependent transporter, partial [Steroidobacteraceae bacterium]
KPVSIVAGILLVVTFLPVLWIARHAIVGLAGNFTIVAIVLLSLAGIAIGHWLGGPDPDNRTALALATATRHPGVALGVLKVISPGDKEADVAVVLYLLVSIVATMPYVMWRKRAHAAQDAK